MAAAILKEFPTLHSLTRIYFDKTVAEETKKQLLARVPIGNVGRTVGLAVSSKVHIMLTSKNPDQHL